MKYTTLNSYLKEKFGCKVYKISLDCGFTCPNRDGTLGYGGCIFCSEGGSGDFAESRTLGVTEQIESGKEKVKKIRIILSSSLKGLFFNPKVEYIECCNKGSELK